MRTDALRLVCDKLKNASFVGFRGKEYISRPYEFELFFTLPAGSSGAKDAVGERAKVEISRDDAEAPVVIHGVIAGLRLMKPLGERVLYRALLVPRLWMLRHFRRSNVFTFQKIKDFLSDTLKDGGLQPNEFRFGIDPGAYPEEEFVAQYRESHLDFFHRWLEREGLFYYFEHKPDADGEVLVIVDDNGGLEAFPGTGPAKGGKVRYFPTTGDDVMAREALHQIEVDTAWLPKSITIEDYDYSNPTAPLKGEGAISKTGVGVIHEYGYRVFVDKDVKRLAKVRAEAIGCRSTTMKAEGDVVGPRAGYKLKIDDRPEDLDEEWLAVEVEHSGSISGWTPELGRLTGLKGSDVYRLEIFAVPAATQYRAPQTTPWPRVNGFENGTVGGPADSEYAQIDADGRYLVRFEFDQSTLGDPKISTRIRMLQPHGGETEGFHFPLRKETEVMVAFLGGDPDRPFIAGVVPNALKPSVVGERNHTQNIIRTGSNNQIVMEDEKGKEFIFMHSPNAESGIYLGNPKGAQSSVYTGEKDQPYLVEGPASAKPGAMPPNWAGPQNPPGVDAGFEGVVASFHPHTRENALTEIGGSSTTVILSGPEHTYVGGDVAHGYKGNYGLMVTGSSDEFYYSTRNTFVGTGRTDTTMGGGFTQKVLGGGMTQEFTDKLDQKVHGPWTNVTDGTFDAKFSGESVKVMATGGKLSMHANTAIYLNAPDIYLDAANIHLTATAAVKADAPSWLTKANSWLKNNLAIESAAYVGKNSLVVEKIDITVGSAAAMTASKFEATGFARSLVLNKADFVAVNTSKTGLDASTKVLEKEDAAAVIANGAFRSTRAGFRLL